MRADRQHKLAPLIRSPLGLFNFDRAMSGWMQPQIGQVGFREPCSDLLHTANDPEGVSERAYVERNCQAPRRNNGEHKLPFKQAGCLWDHREIPLQPWRQRLSRSDL